MFRVSTIIVSPTATTITIETSVAMFCQLPVVAKLSAWIPKIRTVTWRARQIHPCGRLDPGSGLNDPLLAGVLTCDFGDQLSLPHDEDAVAHTEYLEKLRGD